MKYNELKVQKKKSPKRVGRGISAGYGKTAGRGTKGQNSRSGGKTSPGFEGGQNPLYKRLPKMRGFKSHKTPSVIVYTDQLDKIPAKKVIDNQLLLETGLIDSQYARVKLIAGGIVNKEHQVKLQGASKRAVQLVQKAGGNFEKTPLPRRPSSRPKQIDQKKTEKK